LALKAENLADSGLIINLSKSEFENYIKLVDNSFYQTVLQDDILVKNKRKMSY
jgi:hypothetical protein